MLVTLTVALLPLASLSDVTTDGNILIVVVPPNYKRPYSFKTYSDYMTVIIDTEKANIIDVRYCNGTDITHGYIIKVSR